MGPERRLQVKWDGAECSEVIAAIRLPSLVRPSRSANSAWYRLLVRFHPMDIQNLRCCRGAMTSSIAPSVF